MKLRTDLTGRRFGSLVAIEFAQRENKQTKWFFKCDCGNLKVINSSNVTTGKVVSCGCAVRMANSTHNMSGTPEYVAWQNMKDRCYNRKRKTYIHYGGRGIGVYDGWVENFMEFFKHIGPRPSPKHSVDRIDNDLGYFPGNVRWATMSEQMCNSSQNRFLYHMGRRQTIKEWAEQTGINRNTINKRLRSGWTIKDTLETPINKKYSHKRSV